MAKKPSKGSNQAHEPAEEYYKLKTKAVDDLVNATKENSPQVSPEELRKYHSGGKLKIPNWLKVNFVKFWFPAAACFFFYWGLGTTVPADLDRLVILGLGIGIITDLLTNNVLRNFSETKGGNDRWMMFPKKNFASYFENILYAYVVLFLVWTIYTVINSVVMALTGDTDTIALGVEPILFGLFYLGCDLALIELKHLGQRIFEDAKRASRQG